MNPGVHGRSAVSASWRLRVTRSAGRTSLATSHSHSPSRRDASSSRLRPGHGGSGAPCVKILSDGPLGEADLRDTVIVPHPTPHISHICPTSQPIFLILPPHPS